MLRPGRCGEIFQDLGKRAEELANLGGGRHFVGSLHKVEELGQQSLLVVLHLNDADHGFVTRHQRSQVPDIHTEKRCPQFLAIAMRVPDVLYRTASALARENVEIDGLHHLQRDLLEKVFARFAEEEIVHTRLNEPRQKLSFAPTLCDLKENRKQTDNGTDGIQSTVYDPRRATKHPICLTREPPRKCADIPDSSSVDAVR